LFSKINRCYIVAEIGGNFNNYDQAVSLINASQEAGVDCVKLQTFTAEHIVNKKAMFDMEITGKISQYEYFKKHEISKELFQQVVSYLESKAMDWFSTPSHQTDVDTLLSLNVKAIKIGADDANNLPFLKYVAQTKLPVVLSTGMCTFEEVKEAINTILQQGNEKIVIMHTVSGYPTYPEDVNLNILSTYKREFPEFLVGFSDHTLTPLASIAAAAMGADVIEKHFTLDKNAEGPDHIISSNPQEMKYIVDSIREIEKMKGSGIKKPFGPEVQNRVNNRKSVIAIKAIKKGDIVTRDHIDIKRPGYGIAPKYFDQVVGRRANRDLQPDDVLNWSDIS